jgi:hypothetical protein
MSWRIEQADALNLLRELPNRWAQTCVARPPRAGDPERVLAILSEVRRVLRDDGTLWVFLTAEQLPLADELREEGWTQQTVPEWASNPTAGAHGRGARLLLFTKGRRYFYDRDAIAARTGSRRALCVNTSHQARLAQTCLPAREHERRLTLVKRCIRAGSSLVACGECGAPYRRARPGERASGLRHPTCAHNNPGGCCLVLDPFYDRAGLPTAEAALCTGRSFLGITEPADLTAENREDERR